MSIFATKFHFLLIKSSIVKSFSAALMLLVFAFAITPKRYLHNLVADHTDTIAYGKATDGKTELSKAGYHCQVDNLVATSPFTAIDAAPELELSSVFISYKAAIALLNLFPAHTYFSLRGPPSAFSIV